MRPFRFWKTVFRERFSLFLLRASLPTVYHESRPRPLSEPALFSIRIKARVPSGKACALRLRCPRGTIVLCAPKIKICIRFRIHIFSFMGFFSILQRRKIQRLKIRRGRLRRNPAQRRIEKLFAPEVCPNQAFFCADHIVCPVDRAAMLAIGAYFFNFFGKDHELSPFSCRRFFHYYYNTSFLICQKKTKKAGKGRKTEPDRRIPGGKGAA